MLCGGRVGERLADAPAEQEAAADRDGSPEGGREVDDCPFSSWWDELEFGVHHDGEAERDYERGEERETPGESDGRGRADGAKAVSVTDRRGDDLERDEDDDEQQDPHGNRFVVEREHTEPGDEDDEREDDDGADDDCSGDALRAAPEPDGDDENAREEVRESCEPRQQREREEPRSEVVGHAGVFSSMVSKPLAGLATTALQTRGLFSPADQYTIKLMPCDGFLRLGFHVRPTSVATQ